MRLNLLELCDRAMPAPFVLDALPAPLATQLGLTSGIGGEEQGVIDGTFDGAVANLYSDQFSVRQQGLQTLQNLVNTSNVTVLVQIHDALELLVNTTESPEVRQRAEDLLATAHTRLTSIQTLIILYRTVNPPMED